MQSRGTSPQLPCHVTKLWHIKLKSFNWTRQGPVQIDVLLRKIKLPEGPILLDVSKLNYL